MTLDCSRVPWIDPADLKHRAEEFRERYGATEIPVPIDRIVDFDLDIHIAPAPDLHQNFGISGYLTSDCTTIVIDRHCFDHLEATYRYTLAHEVSHIELHGNLWPLLNVHTASEYITAMESGMSEEEHEHLEWQASAFAGCVLVPSQELATQFAPQVDWAREVARGGAPADADRQALYDIALQAVADRLAPHFNVHPFTVGIQIVRDGLAGQLGMELLGDCAGINLRYRNPQAR